MRRKASPTLIGAFVVLGLALVAVTLIALAGDRFFKRQERAVLHFTGSVYGLQVGAPVVFRGVGVGSVASIGVFYDRGTDSFSIPVVVALDADAVSGLEGPLPPGLAVPGLPALVKRGLSAQLAMQSLLTGLLYVDLDLRPERQSALRGSPGGLVEIPTSPTAIQALKDQIEGMDFRRLAEDLSAIAASARAVVSGPQLKQALDDLAQITTTVKRLSQRLDGRVEPLAGELQKSLAATTAAMARLEQAADGVDRTADGLGRTSDRLAELLAPESPLLRDLERTAAELARTAASLGQVTDGDSTLVRGTERALHDVSQAARSLRALAESLEQQPDALLRGRRVAE